MLIPGDVGGDQHRGVLVRAPASPAVLQYLTGDPQGLPGDVTVDPQVKIQDAEDELLPVRHVGRGTHPRFNPKLRRGGRHRGDRVVQERFDPVIVDRALAFQDDLVEVGLGGEPVPAALQPHVPEGCFERVTHVLDEPARQPRAPHAEQHLGG